MDPQEILSRWAPHIRTVPHESTPGACVVCLGTTGGAGWDTCFPCGRRWRHHREFSGACDLIVPCTVAESPSPWYTAMLKYKWAAYWREMGPALVVAFWRWLQEHHGRVSAALDGTPEVVAVVPSTRQGLPTPLFRVVAALEDLRPLLHPAVTFRGGYEFSEDRRRAELTPDAFDADDSVLSGRRVLLVEDTWVSGARALSAAIAVRRASPRSLALVSIARMVYPDAMTPEYEQAADRPVDFGRWPR